MTEARQAARPELSDELRTLVQQYEELVSKRGGSWEQIEATTFPLDLMREMEAPNPYPLEALGAVLGPAAAAIAEGVQVPVAIAANAVLAAASFATQSHADVETLGGSARPLSLYVLTIAASGDRKTAADDVALVPMREHRKRLTKAYNAALQEHELAVEVRKIERQKAREVAKGGEDVSARLKELEDTPPPRKPKLFCSELSAPALIRSFADGQHAQGIFSDEGGKLLGGYAMSDESLKHTIATLSDAWQGKELDRVRATDNEYMVLYGRRLAVHLMVQPDIAAPLLASKVCRTQGFLARFLIAAPKSIAGTRLYDRSRRKPQDDPRIHRYWQAIGDLLEQPAVEDPQVGGLSPPVLRLFSEAERLLAAAYDDSEKAQGRDGALEPVREWASKAAEHACRIAGVLTMVADSQTLFVSGDTMRDALRLTQYYLLEYQRLIGAGDMPEHLERAQAVLEWMRRNEKTEVTARQLMRGPRAVRNADVARQALQTLVQHGWLVTRDRKLYRMPGTAYLVLMGKLP
jgi:hypothetical protein